VACILIVEDEALVLKTVRIVLEHAGHVVFGARDGQECEDVLKVARPDVVVLDIFMPKRDGLEVIRELRRHGRECRILAISGGSRFDGSDPLALAKGLGADATLRKPFEPEELLRLLNDLLPEGLRHPLPA
jgi:DNA-binding response OmpR family regulator